MRPQRSRATDDPDPLGGRFGQFLMLLGLTGFAISQPVLAVTGDDPTVFTFAGVEGTELVLFTLVVAFVPPLALWASVVLVGRLDDDAGNFTFVVLAGLLAGAAVSQWVWLAGLDDRWARGLVAVVAAVGFATLLVRVPAVALWTRYTAMLPMLAVLLLLVASPSSTLLSSHDEVELALGGDLAPVVFVLLDEFPTVSILDDDGTIDATRFPNLARFASGATWYREYTAMSNSTSQSVPTLLSGRSTGASEPLWTQHPDTLFSFLAPTHDLVVSESLTRLCGYAHCGFEGDPQERADGIRGALGRAVDVWEERVGLRPSRGPDLGQFAEDIEPLGPSDATGPDAFGGSAEAAGPSPVEVTALLEATAGAGTPSLSYLHLMLPHQPWRAGPDGEPMEGLDPMEVAATGVTADDWDLAVLQQGHLLQAQYTDHLLGQLLDGLRADGRFDDSLIVVTSDHGVTLDLGQFPVTRTLDDRSLGDLAYVPLLIKAPGQGDGRIDDANLMAVDLLPTIAAELGVEVPWDVEGLPAGDPRLADRGDRKEIHEIEWFDGAEEHTIEFRSGDHRPSAEDRFVGSAADGDHLLAGLLRPIGADRWLGVRVAELDAGPGGTAALALGPDGALDAGRLAGSVDVGGAGDGHVLLSIDGTVQTAAPIQEGGRITLFVAPDADRRSDAELRLFWARDDSVVELAVEPT